VVTSGSKRSIIIDSQRNQIKYISNEIAKLLKRKVLLSKLKAKESNLFDQIMILVEQEFGFFTNQPNNFPTLNLDWRSPQRISNAIIEFNPKLNSQYKKVIENFNLLRCGYVEVRIYEVCEFAELEVFLRLFNNSTIRNIRIYLPSQMIPSEKKLKDLSFLQRRIQQIVVHSHSGSLNKIVVENLTLLFTPEKINSKHCCGNISFSRFATSIKHISESTKYNTCLNGKVSISAKGEIKNCPSLKESFGNVFISDIITEVKRESFEKYWRHNKDKILVCKDCEFRYICMDCRAYIEDPKNKYSKPLKCNYNPYEAVWEERPSPNVKEEFLKRYELLG
jgi:SPASM domain peptide maturase of grasp-with-spasm system